jgi:hypothetical protein
MALIKHRWTSLDIAGGNRGLTPLASKLFIMRCLHKFDKSELITSPPTSGHVRLYPRGL